MRDLLGDSARGADWAVVRLRVDGDVIVEADADGVDGDLRGLTLLEAAAVGGETLPVDALANAIGPELAAPPRPRARRRRDERRRRQRGRAARVGRRGRRRDASPLARPERPRHRARLLLAERCHRRAPALPLAAACPHVTLDLREEFRRAVVAPFVRGYARGETPNPCMRCNGGFRFAELLAFARRVGAGRLVDRPLRAHRRARRPAAARARRETRRRTRATCSRGSTRAVLGRIAFPLGDRTKAETRARAAAAGLAVAARPESQEACFLAGGDYRDFLERHGLASDPGPGRRRDGRASRRARRLLALHRRPAPRSRRRRRPSRCTRSRPCPATNTVVVGPRRSLARTHVTVRGRLFVPVERGEAKLRYRSPAVGAAVEADRRRASA